MASADSKILLIGINFSVSKLKTIGHDFLRFGESLSINDKVVLKFHIGLLPSHRGAILIHAIFPKIDSVVENKTTKMFNCRRETISQ